MSTVLEREFAAAASGTHTPVMLWGPPGVGKSQIVAQVAARRQVPLIDIRLAQMEPTDLRGIPYRDGRAVTWSVPALLPDAERHGPSGVLFLDEITSAVPTVTAAAYQLILDRRLGEYRVPSSWAIFAAGNRHGDRGVTYQMPAPLANRFAHYDIEPELDDWTAWAHASGIDARLVALLRFRPDLLFQFDPARYAAAFPSPRSWEYVKGQMRARVTLLACDTELAPGAPWRFEPWERLAIPPELTGGGGTRFTPVFDWVAEAPVRPDALLYFTDALGEFPARSPEFPVLWLVKGNAPVPWGERVQLN